MHLSDGAIFFWPPAKFEKYSGFVGCTLSLAVACPASRWPPTCTSSYLAPCATLRCGSISARAYNHLLRGSAHRLFTFLQERHCTQHPPVGAYGHFWARRGAQGALLVSRPLPSLVSSRPRRIGRRQSSRNSFYNLPEITEALIHELAAADGAEAADVGPAVLLHPRRRRPNLPSVCSLPLVWPRSREKIRGI